MRNTLYLLSFTVSGIKNIEKPIKLEFYKKTIDRSFAPAKYRIKAIYGENGSGKTAIITAVKILKDIMLDDRYLGESTNQSFLAEIINKRSRRIHLECEFLDQSDTGIEVYRYAIELEPNRLNEFDIVYEVLQYRKGEYTSSRYRNLFECEDGELIDIWADDMVYDAVDRLSTNRLHNCSFLSICVENMSSIPFAQDSCDIFSHIVEMLVFNMRLVVSIEKYDQHNMYFLKQFVEEAMLPDIWNNKLNKWVTEAMVSEGTGKTKIRKKDFEDYKSDVKRLERFLKLFKYDLVSVDIDYIENKEYYECSLVLNYGDYRVNTEFESTGINKLIRLFSSMDAAAAGKIVFIDEMDSNINDIYLCKLVEYFMQYGKGQLCFTTHNTSPMPILRKNKNSIDFLSSDNRIIPWRTNGHFAPDSLYKNGMIPYLPFNIEAEDFLGILGD